MSILQFVSQDDLDDLDDDPRIAFTTLVLLAEESLDERTENLQWDQSDVMHYDFMNVLATKATRGGGPPFRIFGKSAVYQWSDVVAWVLETMGEPARTTSEHRAREGKPAPQTPSDEQISAMVEGSRRYNAERVTARKGRGPRDP